jgi:catechol 2,3-dioxygenase-like lactoylglutathione lyase family enzyme
MSIIALNHTSFTVSDVERSIAFYSDLLGLELVVTVRRQRPWIKEMTRFSDADLKIAALRLPGSDHMLELIEYMSPRGTDARKIPTNDVGATHICFRVTDIDAVYERLRNEGVEFNSPPVTVDELPSPGARCCYFRDPDGIPLELAQAAPVHHG